VVRIENRSVPWRVDQSGLPSLTQIAANRFRLRLFASKAQEAAFNAIIGAGEFGKNTLQHDAVLLLEGQDPVVEEIGGHDRRLAIIELGEANLRIGIDEGLLIDAADAFQGAHIEGV